jgi:hypothetical protein
MKQAQKIKILFVEDLPDDAEMAQRVIRAADIQFIPMLVDTEPEFKDALRNFNPDLVISDYSMPRFDGMSALKITREMPETIPFIVLTGSMNEETAVACMKAGANDYVIKEQIKRLPYAVTEAIEKNEIRKEKEKLMEDLVSAKNRAEESDRLKTAFLANMSHEIRTPMNGILGFLELLNDTDLSHEERLSYVQVINKSGERLLDTINDIIELSKIESGQSEVNIEALDINDILDYQCGFFQHRAEQKGLDFKVFKDLSLGENKLLSDKSKLESILVNLIKNAIKFTHEGFVECSITCKNEHIVISVTDSGPGIPKDRQEAIFERFVQADLAITRPHEGSGLGLAIAKEYTTMLGGTISVDSEPGKGCRFTVVLPGAVAEKADEEIADSEQFTKSEPRQQLHQVVLVVEDDPDSFAYLEIIITGANYRVLHADNGKTAVELSRKHPEIDLILMDLKMPIMDGLEATRRIRQFNTTVPVVAQTAYALAGDSQVAFEAGCNDYITKPVKRKVLLDKLNSFLAG